MSVQPGNPSSLYLSFQGLFSITQARYSMGALGQQQYDAEMQATATVTVVEDGE